jgi:adenylosuccinate lyase
MGREVAHEMIKKHATHTTPDKLFAALSDEKDFPLSLDQLNKMISNLADFAGLALVQTHSIKETITGRIKNKILKVELTDLR